MHSPQQRNLFNRLTDLFSNARKNKNLLNDAGFAAEHIPDEFRCALSKEIMDEPVMIDGNPQHIVNKALLLQIWRDPRLNRINPFTNEPIQYDPTPCDDLRVRINAFVDGQVDYFAKMKKTIEAIKAAFEYDTAPKSNTSLVTDLKLDPSLIPPACCETLLTNKLMTYPVKIDSEYTVDLRSLLSWWNENPALFYKNPFTYEFIKSIETDVITLEIINIFLSQYESLEVRLSDEAIEMKMKAIRENINRSGTKKTTKQCLIEAEINLTSISSRDMQFLMGQNLSDELMTHPVTIDDEHTIDFETLLKWWSESTDNRYINFYTGQRIKSLEYNETLKEKIDSVVESLICANKKGLAIITHLNTFQFGIFHRQHRIRDNANDFVDVTLAQMRGPSNQSS